ncbi:MAG TPA: hypothetical protein VIV60_18410, partial [Polyangiaceae bacterium]
MPSLSVDSNPAFSIVVNGTPLPSSAAVRVRSIRVDEDTDLPGMVALELPGGDPSKETEWIDGSLFAIGGTMEVKLGYGSKLETVIAAEITCIEPAFSSGLPPQLVVRGYDRRHRLQRGRKTRSFVQQKDSDIVSTIASEVGLTAETVDSEVTHDYVLQANQTNMEFLLERARLIRYEIVVEKTTFHFRPVQNDQGEVLTLSPGELLEFYPRLSSMGQLTEVEVRGWDAKEKKGLVASAASGDEVSVMGKDSGASLAASAFGAAALRICSAPALTQGEAEQIARAEYN